MPRVEFKLSMPSNNAWDGKWSGRERNYTKVLSVSASKSEAILPGERSSYTYAFGDGWVACVSIRKMEKGERASKSDGFCGYDWMISSIINKGCISLD